MRAVFRFREVSVPTLPLSYPEDYELLREFLRSGDRVAETFYGVVEFNALGQNVGRAPPTLQMLGGSARVVLPVERQAVGDAYVYPAPGTDCPSSSPFVRYDSDVCVLCAASKCRPRVRSRVAHSAKSAGVRLG